MNANEEPLPTDWWSVDDVLRYLRAEGTPIARDTWNSYVSRQQAPQADRIFGRSPAWLPSTIRSWQSSRPRKGTSAK